MIGGKAKPGWMPRTHRKVSRLQLATRLTRRVWGHPANRRTPVRSLGRAFAWYVRKRMGSGPVSVGAYGLDLEFPRKSGSLSNFFYFGECFEWQAINFVRAYLRPGDQVLDVGANVGMFTYACYQCVKPSGIVVAVEPSPWAASTIRRNALSNQIDDSVQVYEAAAGATPGTAELTADLDVSNHLRRVSEATFSLDTIEVVVRRLDSLVDPHVRLALLKLDVEGAEALALAGFVDHLSVGNPPVILIEAHDHSLRKMGSARQEVMTTLDEVGYRSWCYDAESGGLIEPQTNWREDVIAVLERKRPQVIDRLEKSRAISQDAR